MGQLGLKPQPQPCGCNRVPSNCAISLFSANMQTVMVINITLGYLTATGLAYRVIDRANGWINRPWALQGQIKALRILCIIQGDPASHILV